MNNRVFLLGASSTEFGRFPKSSYIGLAVPAVLKLAEESGVRLADIEKIYACHEFGGTLIAQRIAKEIGIGDIPMVNCNNACSSSGLGVYEAVRAVRSGELDLALVVGVEKLSQFQGGPIPLADEDREVRQGVMMPAIYAMRARRYLEETDATVEDFARVSVKARKNGTGNPIAQLREVISVEGVLSSRMIADPLTLAMCCPTGDGASAVLIGSERARKSVSSKSLEIVASVMHTGKVAEGYRDMTWPEITHNCAMDAYNEAGVEPGDLDLIELHDAFASAELIYYEALGLTKRGEGFTLIRNQEDASVKPSVNPSGGLLARGHPVGATGTAQIYEIYHRLTRKIRGDHVKDPRLGLTHVTGGGISGVDHGVCTVHIFGEVS